MFGWSIAGRTKNGHGEDSICWGGELLKGQKVRSKLINDRKWTCWRGALLKGQKMNMVKRAYTIQGGVLLKGQKNGHGEDNVHYIGWRLLKKQKMNMVAMGYTEVAH